jgi:predicted nuclease of predicted toxin-antitoxin system
VKLLFDSCMSAAVAEQLRRDGVDVVWVGDWPCDPGDPAILGRAFAEERVLVTLDKDFGELAVLGRRPHAGIVRFVEVPLAEMASTCRRVATFYAAQLAAGAIITVEAKRTRVRFPLGDSELDA